jgi:hypothetical protein
MSLWLASTGTVMAADKAADFARKSDRLKYKFVDGNHKYHDARR